MLAQRSVVVLVAPARVFREDLPTTLAEFKRLLAAVYRVHMALVPEL